MNSTLLAAALLACFVGAARAQYDAWPRVGSLYILTTPDGVDLPATVSEQGFPLLVRLTRESFDFSQAMPHGEDLRFSAAGSPLLYQIEQWDPARGVAAVWVRIPVIKGNERQEIRMHWGKPGATTESNGAAVFDDSNGYLAVMHLGDPARDETGHLKPIDTGTTPVEGIVGSARHFAQGHGINCGEAIPTLPMGSADHTTEVWMKPEGPNAVAIGWGNERAQGKVTMLLASPPHIRMDCYFSEADLHGTNSIPMGQWTYVVHTYKKGESRLYVNGRPDIASTRKGSPLALTSPARMYLGGWYGDYHFSGDLDEARVSRVVRSPEWVRLEYENQKPNQTLVGTLVRPGNEFSVSSPTVTIDEGKSATVSAKADGAQKVSWSVVRDGVETIASTDHLAHAIEAGRVVADTSYILRFKAVYPDAIRTRDVAVTVRNTIPEPAFTLKAPKRWDGRETIEVVPVMANLSALKSKRADKLRYQWSVEGGAVISEVAADRLVLRRSQCNGPITVRVSIDNGGAPTTASTEIRVTEPKADAWVERIPERDEKPVDGQFYARDDRNAGTLYYNGRLDAPVDAVFLDLYADGVLAKSQAAKPGRDGSYKFAARLKPGLVKYSVEFGTRKGGIATVLHTVTNLVCGDAYLIDGQSNALATDTAEKSPPDTSEWIRSYGRTDGAPDGWTANGWCYPVWKAEKGEAAELGYWGMELAKRLVASERVPVFIVNGAVGGTRIDQHQRNESNPADPTTIYGRMLRRVREARLTHGIRAVLWHQGENDQGSDGPTGGYGWESYRRYFVDMSAGWKRDFPNVGHYYIYQIWPNSCAMGNGHGDMLREVQRTLPRYYSHMDVIPTLGIRPPGGCHFPLAGWAEFARLVQPLIERDFYGKIPAGPVTGPNLRRAYHAGGARDTVTLEFDQPVVWQDALAGEFYMDGEKGKVASGSARGNTVTVVLKGPPAARTISYLIETSWSQDRLLLGTNGIAALTFCEVPIK